MARMMVHRGSRNIGRAQVRSEDLDTVRRYLRYGSPDQAARALIGAGRRPEEVAAALRVVRNERDRSI